MKLSVYVFGSNPLPTFMALCYDMGLVEVPKDHKKPDRLLFVYSKDTKEFAENCENKIEVVLPSIKRIELENVYNSVDIYDKVYNQLKEIDNEENVDNIFLNNTGGTKVMSVSTTMAIVDFVNKDKVGLISVCEVDIDPISQKFQIHNPCLLSNCNGITCWPDDGTDYNKAFEGLITISDITELYGYKVISKKRQYKYTMETCDKTLQFGRVIMNNLPAYKQFMKAFFGVRYAMQANENITGFPKFVWQLSGNDIGLQNSDENKGINIDNFKQFFIDDNSKPQEVSKTVLEYYEENCETSPSIVSLLVSKGLIDRELYIDKNLLKYLIGTWLEEYICAIIERILEENDCACNISQSSYEVFHSFKAKPSKSTGNGNSYEIDIVFRNGTTITFISCTTDDETFLAKHKIHEVLHNADTLGLRTKAIMVTFLPEAKGIKYRERNKSFSVSEYKELKILHIENMINKDNGEDELKEWFRKNLRIGRD